LLEIFRRGLARSCLGWVGVDGGVADTQLQAPFSANNNWNSAGIGRQYISPQNFNARGLTVRIDSNANGIAGADLTMELDLVPTALVVPIDQLTGILEDITNVILITREEAIAWQYNQGNGNVSISSVSMIVEIGS